MLYIASLYFRLKHPDRPGTNEWTGIPVQMNIGIPVYYDELKELRAELEVKEV